MKRIRRAIIARVRGLPDYHVHTFRCGHAGGASRDFVLRALDARPRRDRLHRPHPALLPARRARATRSSRCARTSSTGYVRGGRGAARGVPRAGSPSASASRPTTPRATRRSSPGGSARADWDLVLGSVHWVAGDWIDDPAPLARALRARGHRGPLRRVLPPAREGRRDRVLRRADALRSAEEARPPARRRRGSRPRRRRIAAAPKAGCAVEISSAGSAQASRRGLSGAAPALARSSAPAFP